MKHNIIALFALVATSFAAIANPVTVDQLVEALPAAKPEVIRRTAVFTEARRNSAFYETLAARGFKIEDVELAVSQIVPLHVQYERFDRITDGDAAKFLAIGAYKSYVAAKLKGYGTALEAYDWLQQQRLTVVQAGPKNAAEKEEFLVVIAEQVAATDKAKPKE